MTQRWPDTSPCEEAERLAALDALDILDTGTEREFDELTELARAALGTESAAVSLIDDRRQWFKARTGIEFAETPRDIAFCTHAVAERARVVVCDAHLDARFADNPLVRAPGGIRFYAGVPLIVSSGACIGTLCVFDPTPRQGLTRDQDRTLRLLARRAVELIETRRSRKMSEIAAEVVEASLDAVVATDTCGRVVYLNASAERLFGRPSSDILGLDVQLLSPTRFGGTYGEADGKTTLKALSAPTDEKLDLLGLRADGSDFPIEVSFARWGSGLAGSRGVAAVIRDISKRRTLEHEREQARRFLDNVVSNLPVMLFVKDARTRAYVMINKAGEAVMGRPASEIIGVTDRDLFPRYGADFERRDIAVTTASEPQVFESTFARPDGGSARLRTTRMVIDGPDRPDQYILGVTEDVTPTRTAEAAARRLAQHDDLTGLLNRSSAAERLDRLAQAGVRFALLSVDLRRFRTVNEQFGEPTGDIVLIETAARLRKLTAPSDWIARVGSNEFAIALLGADPAGRASALAEAAVACLAEPFETPTGQVTLGAVAGLVLAPQDGPSADALREHVDLALHRAKAAGPGSACFYNSERDAETRDRRKLAADLRRAVMDGEITLAYQPLVSATTGRITSAEALARWTHPTHGPVRPDVFIALAEEAGLIDALGRQLLRQACSEALSWPETVRVAVNLSPLQFESDALLESVRATLADTGLQPGRLQLEVTEGLVIRDVERTFQQLEALRALGIQILIDDFGVGYSSLSYFQRFPFDKVKLDKSFIDDVETSRTARAIVTAVVGLGQALDMGVVAEGVEREAQMKILTELGCTHLQGYYFSAPLPASALRGLISATRPLVGGHDEFRHAEVA